MVQTLKYLGKSKYFIMAFSQFLLALIDEMITIPHSVNVEISVRRKQPWIKRNRF